MWRGLAVVVLVLAGVVMLPESASACSCAWGDPREMLADGDAAFVGALIDREEPPSSSIYSSADEVTYTFEVEQSIKGDLGETVEVESAIEGASCGFEVAEGQRIGVILYRDGDRWTGGLCSQVDPDALIHASQPIPPPDGEGPVSLLMPLSPEDERYIALDTEGRVLAYVESETGSQIQRMAVCPGSERLVEFVFEGQFPRLAIRNLRTLEVERILRPEGLVPEVRAMQCLTPDGQSLLLHQTNYLEIGGETRIVRVQGDESTVIYEAATNWMDYVSVAFDAERGLAYTVDPENRFQVLAVDLDTGESRVVSQVVEPGDRGGIYQMAINPAGTVLAVAVEEPASRIYPGLYLIDVTVEPVTLMQVGSGSYSYTGPTWIADDRLMVNGYLDNSQDVLIYDSAGALVRTIPDYWLDPVTARGDVVYGAGCRYPCGMVPSLFSITLPNGEPQEIRPMDRPYIHYLVAVPDDIEIEATLAPPVETAAPTPDSTSTATSEATQPSANAGSETATHAERAATPAEATATPVESGQVGGEDDPSDADGAAASIDAGPGIGTVELAIGVLVLGAVALAGWLVLRRRRQPAPAVEPGP